MSIVFNELPNFQFTENILNQFISTMIFVQSIKTTSYWRNYDQHELYSVDIINSNLPNDRIKNSILIANKCVNMMQNDKKMLGKFYSFITKNKSINIDLMENIKQNSDCDINIDTQIIAFDMHCYPAILIELQGSLSYIPTIETLQFLSSFIWSNSSSYNTRYPRSKIYTEKFKYIMRSLMDIQYYHITTNDKLVSNTKYFDVSVNRWILKNPKYNYVENLTDMTNDVKRDTFLLIFGRTYRIDKKINNKIHTAIICGNDENITKIKLSSNSNTTIYIDGKNRFLAEKEFVEQYEKDGDMIDFKLLTPPTGWKWKNDLIGKQKLMLKLISSDDKKMTNNIDFFVGNYKLEPFDGSQLIEKINCYQSENNIPEHLEDLLNVALYVEIGNNYETIVELYEISKYRYSQKDFRIFDIKNILINIDAKILLYVKARILMATDLTIIVGPCDRGGNKTHNSISYQYEGVMWRLLCVLSAIYPNTLKTNTMFNYTLNKSTFGYFHMIGMLNSLTLSTKKHTKFNNIVKLKTILWDHQKTSVDKISNGFINGKKGFGDASGVGTGKTLVALGVIINLYNKCKTDNIKIPNKGFLIMLPTEILYDTWKNEITKHTNGLNVVEQYSNGLLSGNINDTTIVITTMGRCRDHPLLYQWLLVVIDECLTVQNKEALQTEEAWRQTSYSYFGVLMLSATFFRSRFDKMTHMLNMLNDTLPKTNDYLDTLLSESIVCNLNENERKWTTHVSYFDLDHDKKQLYLQILSKKDQIGPEKVYIELEKFINNNVDYVELFKKTINNITQKNPNAKILIYANSKSEADIIANNIDNVSRFQIPINNSNNSHIVVSYTEGTFGLNNLTNYNTILSRPPEPDKLPQMKGRLDRPEQQYDELHLEYIVLKNTIEEAGLIRLEICKNFYGNYIMPLAEWFNIALNNNEH